jgi:chromosome segregation ATPase
MSHSASIAHSAEISARVSPVPREADQDWERVMRENVVTAPPAVAARDFAVAQEQTASSEHLVQGLHREIARMLGEIRRLETAAGLAEGHQQNQINSLMMMIGSLTGSINAAQRATPEYENIQGLIAGLLRQMTSQHVDRSSGNQQAQQELGQLQAQQASLQQALAQILQQLTSLHLRMGSLKPLV